MACLERDLEELLAFYACPEDDWRKTRTTNAIERCFGRCAGGPGR